VEEQASEFIGMAVSPHKTYGYFLTQTNYLYCFSLKTHKLEAFTKISNHSVAAMAHHPKKNLISVITELGEILFLEP
jgi:hypothetical protein